MNRKLLNYAIFLAIVLLVVGLAVRHSRYMRGLVDGMAGPNQAVRIRSVRTLVEDEQFMDAITGESMKKRVAIVQALQDWASEPVPAGATSSAAKAGPPKDAITQIIAFMKDPDSPVRDRLVLAMVASATKSADNLTAAVAGLKEVDANTRKCVVEALQVIGQTDPAKANALLVKATPDNTPAQHAEALAGINAQVAAQLIPDVVAIMKTQADARTPGGDVLGALVDSREASVAALMPLLKDSDAGVRAGAASALGKVGSKTPIPQLIAMMRSDTAANRTTAIIAIAMIADPSGEAALRGALANTANESEARVQAALGLGRIATPTAMAALTKALTDYDLRVVDAAVTGLATAGGKAVPSLEASAKSPDATVRLHSLEALGKIAMPSADQAMIAALDDTDARVRVAAAEALGFEGNSGGVAPLVAKLGAADGAQAAAAADALAQIGAPAEPALVKALSGPDQQAYFAAQALGRIGQSAVAAVNAAATGSGPVSRWSAVALGGIGGPNAVSTLRRLASSSDPSVRTAADMSLQRLGVL